MIKKKNKIKNKIDINFNNLINYLKDHNIEEIKEIIKHNLAYFLKTDRFNYLGIIKFYNDHKLWGTIDLEKEIYEVIDNNAKTLIKHYKDFKWLYRHLEDYRSKKILLTILTYWLMFSHQRIKEIDDKTYSQYFDLDLIQCDKNEVIVDIGAYIGDTLVSYINEFGKENYKKYYCYEIVPANIDYIKQNIGNFKLKNVIIKDKGATNKEGISFLDNNEVSSISKLNKSKGMKVKTVTIDKDIDGPVTLIKMDIEGGEEKALLGCSRKIKEYHPKLAISVYHNNDHLWKIARLIKKLDPTYKLYLRYYGGTMLPTEYLLYAI